ncbi:MAG: hypothetical protein ABSB49_17825, partial [Polyangia bacterium]
MRTTTALAQDTLAARIACWSLALIGLAGLAGCARGLDAGNLQCSNNGPCPAGYVCSSKTATVGYCVRPDGSANQSGSPGRDGGLDASQAGGAGGSASDGARGSGGTGGAGGAGDAATTLA